jgi:hypothetical protein
MGGPDGKPAAGIPGKDRTLVKLRSTASPVALGCDLVLGFLIALVVAHFLLGQVHGSATNPVAYHNRVTSVIIGLAVAVFWTRGAFLKHHRRELALWRNVSSQPKEAQESESPPTKKHLRAVR